MKAVCSANGTQHYRCQSENCTTKSFILEYRYCTNLQYITCNFAPVLIETTHEKINSVGQNKPTQA
ncbi:MAG: hypothetical protein NTW85_04665 [Methylococcales bacterium]|nr:hypothetical protein [Methylococcales bacterium]